MMKLTKITHMVSGHPDLISRLIIIQRNHNNNNNSSNPHNHNSTVIPWKAVSIAIAILQAKLSLRYLLHLQWILTSKADFFRNATKIN